MNPSIMTRLNYSERFTGIEKRLKTAKCRRAYSLVELMIAMVTGSILITGMTASVLMSQRSLAILTDGQDRIASQRQVLNQLRTDLREATSINMTDPSVWSVVVPDRNNDGVNESIQYRLPTTTSTISRNAWSTEIFYPNNNLVHFMRDKPSMPVQPTNPAINRVVIEGVSANSSNETVSRLTVNCPGTSNVNDMQIAILASGPGLTNLVVQGNSWQSMYSTSTGSLRLAIWARLVSNDSTDIVFTGSGGDRLSACVIRLSGHDDAFSHSPINRLSGSSTRNPSCYGHMTFTANELHFRVLAATGNGITQNFTGLSRNNCLVMITGGTSSNSVTLGVGSEEIPTATSPFFAPTLNFNLTASASFITYPFSIKPSE
jgi:type II secretory pathway pseudopilin PulG